MNDQGEWPPERLRALDRAVAEARGSDRIGECPKCDSCFVVPSPVPAGGLFCPDCPKGGLRGVLQIVDDPAVSLGCRETFELMEEARIDVDRHGKGWRQDGPTPWRAHWGTFDRHVDAPTPAIAICLAYLAAKGVPFNG